MPIDIRTYGFKLTPRNKAATVALVIAALAAGATLVAFGLVLLLGLAAVGTVLGAGAMLYNRVAGGRHPLVGRGDARQLDARIEVMPSAEVPPRRIGEGPAESDDPHDRR